MTGGTFAGHASGRGFGRLDELVKNADENWPTASRAFPEVTATASFRNRDDYRGSPTECALAECAESG
ncbi:hypothetical protein [Streptomyces davaonensis]|uniref:hypothetical protein n=1 Tax=Streptomyces davaonensis TaxID=348043 RepID=UPI0012FF9F3C|nr:hypothetical protein [Streptomyces davaonensis]